MGRDGDPDNDGMSGIFRSSRRVNFVVRSGSPARRFSSSRVSRDPMQSLSVDVEEAAPPRAEGLGLEDDWSGIIAPIVEFGDKWMSVALIDDQSGELLAARAKPRGDVVYIVVSDPDAIDEEPLQTVSIRHDLFALVRTRRAAIGITIGSTNGARLVSYKSISKLFEPASASLPEKPLETAAPTPEPVVTGPPGTDVSPHSDPVAARGSSTEVIPRPDPGAAAQPTEAGPGATRIRALTAPRGFPDTIQERLAERLGMFGSDIGTAMLFQVEYSDGNAEYLVGFSGAPEARHDEIETAVNQALSESRRNISLGITFMAADDPMLPRISRIGLMLGGAS